MYMPAQIQLEPVKTVEIGPESAVRAVQFLGRRLGHLALGRGDRVLRVALLAVPHRGRMHELELLRVLHERATVVLKTGTED